MTQVPFLKANEKLPRGSYFYIKVGHRFYAGEEAEAREVKKSTEEPFLSYFNKDGTKTSGYRKSWRENYSVYNWPRRTSRNLRDARKGTVATYKKVPKKPEAVIIKEFTGKLSPRLVDTVAEAKQYRRQDLVQNACERIKTVYSGLDVKVSVGYVGGTK